MEDIYGVTLAVNQRVIVAAGTKRARLEWGIICRVNEQNQSVTIQHVDTGGHATVTRLHKKIMVLPDSIQFPDR